MKNLKVQNTGFYLAGSYVRLIKRNTVSQFTPIGNGIAIAKLHVQVQMDRKLQCQSVRTAATRNP